MPHSSSSAKGREFEPLPPTPIDPVTIPNKITVHMIPVKPKKKKLSEQNFFLTQLKLTYTTWGLPAHIQLLPSYTLATQLKNPIWTAEIWIVEIWTAEI